MTSMKLARGGGKRGFARHVMLGSTALAALAAATPADAATYTVTDQASLIAAINAANASAGSDTIILANDISMSALMPVISDSLVIDGGGYALTNDQRLFFVDSAAATVDIANFSALTGSATGGAGGNQAGGGMGAGGAIFVNAGTVNVSNVSFDGNAATGGAGGAQAPASDSPGGGGGGLGGAGGMGGSNFSSGAGGGGGFSGGGGGGGGIDNSTTAYSNYVDLVSPSSSYNYTSSYGYTSTPGAGGAGLEGSGGNGAGQGTGSAGAAGGSGGFGGSAATSSTSYVNQPTTTDSCYYSYGWWGGGWYCYTDDAHTQYYTESGTASSGGGGGGSGSGAGNGGDGTVATSSYSYSYTYYGYSYGSGTVTGSQTYVSNQAGGGGGGGGLGGGGGNGGSLYAPAADGGYGTGGGGASGSYAYAGGAGDGGVFGGGGGAGYGGSAGAGGFGGGGGGGGYGSTGGVGGFGGGGGGGVYSSTVVGGFAGGQGGQNGGGGGAGLGGAIFANAGATLNIGGGVNFQGSSATGGAAGSNGSAYYPSTAGQGLGSDLFLMSGTTTGFNIASGQTAVLTGTIADDSANTLAGGTGSGATVAVRGGGTLEMQGQSTIGGGYVVDGSALQVTSTGMIDATGSAVQLIGTGSLLDNAGTLYGDGTGVLANGIDATIVNRAGGVIGSGAGNAISVASGSAFMSLDTGSTLNGSIDNSAGASVTARIGGQVNGGYVGGIGSDAVRVDASGHVTGDINLGGGNDSFASAGTIDGTVDGGDGADTYYQIVDGTTANRTLTDLLAGTTNFERFGMAGNGTLVLSGAADASTPDLVAGAGVNEGMLVLDNTSGLTSDIYVNGAVLRVVGDGATGTGTIHMVDPTISFATNGTYANDFALEVASPASADPTVFQVDPGVSVILTGTIATGSAPGTDPVQYVTVDGSGDVMMTNSANSWTGTTTVNAGARLIGSSQSISGSSIVNDGTLYYVQGLVGGDDTVSQNISGNGVIVAQGLAGYSFTFAGSVTGSTLYSNIASLILTNDVSLTNGVVLDAGDQLTLASGATLTAGGTAVFGYGDNSIVNAGSIAGGVVMADPTKSLTLDNQAGGVISATGSNAIAVRSYGIDGSNDGKIVGQWMGMVADGAMDFTNRGLIASGTLDSLGNLTLTGNDGVEILGGGTFTNAAGGQVLGNITGVLTNTVADASIINSGSIAGNQYGSYAYIGTNLTNNAGGTISGGTYGVSFDNAGTNLLVNDGTVTGGNQAVANIGSGSATIVNGGDIEGGLVSVGGGDLDITSNASGNIVRVASGSAIDLSNGGKLTLNNAGDIVGSLWGVVGRNTGDSIVNSGRIATGSFSGETITAGGATAVTLALGGTITNNAGGQILGGTNAILTQADASITNHGLIEGQSGVWSNGVAVSGGTASIDNDGMIVGHSTGNAIYVTSAATVTNNAGGQIIANDDPLAWGVAFDLGATSGTVTNHGTISAGVGVFMGSNVVGGDVTNDGSITGLDIGVQMLASGSVTNASSISGGNYGVSLANGGSIDNAGDISATLGGYTAGIQVGGGDFTLVNDAGGTISGATWGLLYASNGALNVTNAGSMFGGTFNAIYAGSGDAAQIDNLAGGSLIGANAAIYSDGTNLHVDNAGLIRVTGGTQDTVVSGIYASQSGASVTNSGTIESTLAVGNGIRLDQGGTVANSGTIAGGTSGLGIDLADGGSVTNQSGGTISGGTAAILVGGAAAGTLDLQAGSTTGLVGSTGTGVRSVTVAGSLVGYDASGASGIDTFSLAATGSTGGVMLGDGDDSFTTFGGAITGNVDGGAGTDSLTFDVAGNVTYGGNFTAFETGTKTGAGRVSLTGTNSVNTMFVNGGVLTVNGILGSAVTVNSGGTLGGTGTVNGSLLIASGGHLAPGNSIGTITVNGPVTFAAGSTYDVEINPTSSDKLVATGAVTINGGTVNVIGAAGAYAPLTTYQIIQGASVTGTFTSVVDNLAFLDPTLTYTANSVNLVMRRNDIAFAAVASNANQRSAANGVQSLGNGALYDAVLVQDGNGARAAYDALAGAVHPSIAASLAQRDRLRTAQLDQAAAGGEGVAVWADASAGTGNIDATGNGAFAVKGQHRDLLAGVRYDHGPLSLIAGGGRMQTDIDQRRQQGSGDVGSWLLGGQVGYRAGAMRANVGLTYADHNIDVRREVRFPGFAEALSSSRGGSSRSVYGEVAYATGTDGLNLEPFAGASWQKVSLDSVNETGGLSALSIGKIRMSSTLTEVGVRFSATQLEGHNGLYPMGTLAWQHRFGDRHADMTAALAGGDTFTIHGAALSRDALRANVGVGYRIGAAQVALTYDGRLAGRDTDHAVRATLSVGF